MHVRDLHWFGAELLRLFLDHTRPGNRFRFVPPLAASALPCEDADGVDNVGEEHAGVVPHAVIWVDSTVEWVAGGGGFTNGNDIGPREMWTDVVNASPIGQALGSHRRFVSVNEIECPGYFPSSTPETSAHFFMNASFSSESKESSTSTVSAPSSAWFSMKS